MIMLVLLAAQSAAPTNQQILWRDISAGMSAEQVQRIYPAVKGLVHHKAGETVIERVQQVGSCHPDVIVEHPKGMVTAVEISSRLHGFPATACVEDAEKALLGKYGSPAREERSKDGHSLKQVWLTNGLMITYEQSVYAQEFWHVRYEIVKDVGL